MGIKNVFFISLRVCVAFGILYYLFSRIPLSIVISSLTSSKFNYLVMASIITLVMHLIAGYRLKFFTKNQGLPISLFQAIEINMSAVFYGIFLPGGNLSGGAIRFYKLSGRGKNMNEALAALALDRVIATLALCIVGMLFWLIHMPSESGYIVLSMTFLLVGLALLNIFLFTETIHISKGIIGKIISLIERLLVLFRLKKLIETFHRFKGLTLKSIFFILTLSIVSQLLGVLVFYQLALSLGMDISFVAMGWVRCAVVLITMVPITIAGLGVREGALIFLLRPYGVQDDQAVALSILVFAVTVLMIGLLGGLIEGIKLFLPINRQS